jgi:hypothetical protein
MTLYAILLILYIISIYSSLLHELTISYGSMMGFSRPTVDVSVSVNTDKRNYVTAEPIQISGIVLARTVNPIDNSTIQPTVELLIYKGIINYTQPSPNNIISLSRIAVENGSFSAPTHSVDEPGYYTIIANATYPLYGEASFTVIRVIDVFLTFPFYMIYLAIACFGGLMYYIIISEKRRITFATNEVIRLVLLTIIVISPIVGLLYSESQIGINSPISFIKSPQNEESGDQWVINVGGLKTNNYQTGILIPIYVIIFGIAGGYLRYLYRTSKLRTNIESGQEMRLYLFNWESVPGNVAESNRLKDFLIHNFDISWLNRREFIKSSDNKTISITSGDNTSQVSIVLDDTLAKAEININGIKTQELNAIREKDRTNIYQEMSKRRWTLYQSLEDLALLLLSPLLAIAIWFILTRGGTVDKHIIAAVCFTVGLITDRIIITLTNLGSGLLSPKEDSPKRTLPS